MKVTYLSEIIEALNILNGCGSLTEINELIENRDILPNIHTNKNWKRNVSTTIQRHCKETKSYSGGKNVFYSVYGIGEGYWGLIDFKSENTNELNPIDMRIQKSIINNASLDITEKEMLIKARIGQGIFRDRLIAKYTKCIITGITDCRLLLASHIKPWRTANNIERLSEENGLLLSPLYDKLFDTGLISFSEDMKIILSSSIYENDKSIMNIDTDYRFIKLPSLELRQNMEYHRDVIFQG